MRLMTWSGAVLRVRPRNSAAIGRRAPQAQPAWQCSASAVSNSLAGNPPANPVTASGTPCVSSATGLDSLPSPLGLPPGTPSRRAPSSATTVASPGGRDRRAPGRRRHRPRREPRRPASARARAPRRSASAPPTRRPPRVCVAGSPVLDGSSEATGRHHRRPGGPDRAGRAATRRSSSRRSGCRLVDLKFDEQIRTGGSLAVNALHLKVLSAAGTPLLDVIAGAAQRRLRRQRLRPARSDPDRPRQRQRRQRSGNSGNGSANGADSRTSAGQRRARQHLRAR